MYSLSDKAVTGILVFFWVGVVAAAGTVLVGIPWLAWFLFTHLEWVG